jgi:hypothetical protein
VQSESFSRTAGLFSQETTEETEGGFFKLSVSSVASCKMDLFGLFSKKLAAGVSSSSD